MTADQLPGMVNIYYHHGNRGLDLVIFLVNRWVSETMKAAISCLNNSERKQNKMVNNGLLMERHEHAG